jgi:ribosomal-protein-alanine N-acetyltransferase
MMMQSSHTSFHILPCDQTDAPLMGQWHRHAFSQGWSDQTMLDWVSNERACCFKLMVDAGDGASFAGFIIAHYSAVEADLITLVVLPSLRKQGYGKALLEHVITHLQHLGVDKLFLEVAIVNDAAQSLYTKLGFTVLSRRKNYSRIDDGRFVDALVMMRLIK